MTDLKLTRVPGDRRCYALEGVGTLRLRGLTARSATAEAGERSWEISRHGIVRCVIEATDAAGTLVGEFEGRTLRRGGTLRWSDRELALRPDSIWRERYALADGERSLVTIEGKGWGKRPVGITTEDPAAVDAGLLLFAAFVVRALSADAQASAGGAGGAAS